MVVKESSLHCLDLMVVVAEVLAVVIWAEVLQFLELYQQGEGHQLVDFPGPLATPCLLHL
jgi:hypothetical protein